MKGKHLSFLWVYTLIVYVFGSLIGFLCKLFTLTKKSCFVLFIGFILLNIYYYLSWKFEKE